MGIFDRTDTKQLAILPVEMMPQRRTNGWAIVLIEWICRYEWGGRVELEYRSLYRVGLITAWQFSGVRPGDH